MRARIAVPLCLFAVLFYSGCGEQPKSDDAGKPKPASPTAAGGDAANSSVAAIDLRFVPADAFAVHVAYPARVMANPAFAKLDLSDMMKNVENEMGFSPADVEQAETIISFRPDEGHVHSLPEPMMGMEIRLTKPHGGEVFVKHAISHSEPQKIEFAGKSYYKPGKTQSGYQPSSPAIYLIDDRTFLIGEEPQVKAMMDAKDVKSPLVQLLAKVDPSADFSLVVTANEPIRKIAADAKAKGNMPPQMQPFANAVDLMAGSITAIKTTPEISLSLLIEGKDEASAEKLAALVPQAKQFAEQGVALLHQMAGGAPPDVRPMFDYGFAKLDKIVAGIVAQRKGNEVVIQIDGLGTLDELATKVLTPAITQARAAAKRVQGMNNLRQLGLAMLNYESQFQSFPSQAIYSVDGKPLLSWRVSVLPYVEENELYKQFHLDEPWDSPNNKPLIAKMPKVFMDPNDKDAGIGKTRYVVPVGKGTMFDGDKVTKMAEITDGTSNTVMIVEVGNDKAVTWTQPDDLHFDPAKPLDGLGAIGDEGFYAAFADCSVRLLRKTIDADTFRKLILRADGEPIDQSKL